MRIPSIAGLLTLVALVAPAARAADVTPPNIQHTPVTRAPAGNVTLTAVITDESRIFPQLFVRPKGGAWRPPVDLKKAKGAKDTWEVSIKLSESQPLEYYLECYDEYGNGPARYADPDKPILLEAHAKAEAENDPAPGTTVPVRTAKHEPAPVRQPEPARVEAAPAVAHDDAPVAKPARASAPAEAIAPARNDGPLSVGPGGALVRSIFIPGWGQFATERKVRGTAFFLAAAGGAAASVIMVGKAKTANQAYESAPASVQQAAYDQAQSYAHGRDAAIGLTAAVWGLNMVEAYLLHGSRD